ncbi:Mitochondrial substrate carrier family protein [Euphorbia peplus]|nr:Mitochondrial substrate carrier family protein [Euphorbia peplus]
MSGTRRPPQTYRHSIKYRCNKVEGAAFGISDVVLDKHNLTTSEKKKRNELKQPEILSTTELISAVGHVWNTVTSFPTYGLKGNSNHNGRDFRRSVTLSDPIGALEDDSSYFGADIRRNDNFSSLVRPKFEFLKVTQKISMFGPSYERLASLPQFLTGRTKRSSVGISYELERTYESMSEKVPPVTCNLVDVSKVEDKKTDKICSVDHEEGSISREATYLGSNFAMRSAVLCSETIKSKDASCHDNMKVTVQTDQITSIHSDYFLVPPHDDNVSSSVSWEPNSSVCADDHDSLSPQRSAQETFQPNVGDDILVENIGKQPPNLAAECKNTMEMHPSACEKSHHFPAKQEHAFAGASAGIFVSLCLHPVDTVKTVTQSFRADQKSIYDIGRSIVSERGITGFYRGIASNIASSAPVSAIYTFTYESVKGSLLPLFSKEYYPLAHCIAGGSASIATSFVFTPSERVKQQMQIGSRYQNCWSALVGIIRKGGLPSLYAGWGAVLCRNVPHSVIKFYVYENLKHLMLSSQKSAAQPNTLQTLVCGGMAGSTAALFTTPFDVVKTRLQTQVPGSISQYDGVFHALKEIGKTEGLKGLYRGLIPRLVMYVSQGALFFASYEFFKRLFSVELQQFSAQRIQNKEGMEDNQQHGHPDPCICPAKIT